MYQQNMCLHAEGGHFENTSLFNIKIHIPILHTALHMLFASDHNI
jgi:hypothetical protein